VKIIFTVEEKKVGNIYLGISQSGDPAFPVSGSVSWKDNNFLGEGLYFDTKASVSPSLQSLSASFVEKYFLGMPLTAGVDFSLENASNKNVLQDFLNPIFGDNVDNAVPDPYDGHYVYPDTGASWDYIGQGVPTQAEIEAYGLLTDYEYAIENNIPVGDEYLMDYSSFMISLGGRTGYRWDLPYGKVNVSGRLGLAFSWVDYDENAYRPYDWSVRTNDNTWLPNNTLTLGASFDSRDIYLNPSKGFMFSESLMMVGGFLNLGFGNRHYIRSQTKAEAYLTLLDVELTDDYTFKMILAGRGSFTTILPTFGYADSITMVSDLPVIDGMNVGRGWWNRNNDNMMLEGSVELRMPVIDPMLWGALYFDAASVYSDINSLAGMGLDDYQFSFGAGLHLNLSIFPIRIYLAKRFYFDEAGKVQWPVDPILPDFLGGFQFVFTVAGMF
jgi:outer membrane protein insertion porin family